MTGSCFLHKPSPLPFTLASPMFIQSALKAFIAFSYQRKPPNRVFPPRLICLQSATRESLCHDAFPPVLLPRYIAIVHPTSDKRTIQWTIIINLLVWLGSFLLTVPVMMYAKVVGKRDLEMCMMYLDGPQDMYWYTLYQSILGFIIPLVIISTFYSLTLYHVFSSIRRVKRKQSVWAKRATKTVLMVIALFLVCWSPYHVIQVVNLRNHTPTTAFIYAYNISICLSYSHSCINPLMLLIFAQNYRERLCRRNALLSSQHSSKTTSVRPDGSSLATEPSYRCTPI